MEVSSNSFIRPRGSPNTQLPFVYSLRLAYTLDTADKPSELRYDKQGQQGGFGCRKGRGMDRPKGPEIRQVRCTTISASFRIKDNVADQWD